jgi:hypothetical protein
VVAPRRWLSSYSTSCRSETLCQTVSLACCCFFKPRRRAFATAILCLRARPCPNVQMSRSSADTEYAKNTLLQLVARHRNSTRSSAYTSAVFSETRYALNGDLRVAYRASREGSRDIVSVANWFTCCEVLPELPSHQGWVEAMTSLGRLIFFDQPGTGASDPVTAGACRPWSNGPTASPRCSTISGVAKRFSSRRTPRSRQRRCSRRHIRLAPPRWSCSAVSQRRVAPHSFTTKRRLRWSPCGGAGRPNI